MGAPAGRRILGAILLAATLLAGAAFSARADGPPADPTCVGADGRIPIVEPGRDRDLRALFGPYVAGEPMPDVPGSLFRSLTVSGSTILARLETPAGDVDLRLRPLSCAPDAAWRTPSFVLDVPAAPPAPGAQPALAALERALRANDAGHFWRASVPGPPPAAATPGAAPAAAPPGPPPFNASVAAIALLLALAALAALADALRAARDPRAPPFEPGHLLAALGLTALALGLRAAVGPTFIREAYIIPDVSWLLDGPRLASPVASYPQAPQLLSALLAPLTRPSHPGDPIGAVLAAHTLLGALTVLPAWLAGRALAGPTAGLIAATLLTFSPHHIRLSASESTHVVMVLAAFAAFAAALHAARTPRLTATFAALTAAAALVTTRPEAALLGPPIALAALAHGPELRRRLLHPATLALLALLAWLTFPTLRAIAADATTASAPPPPGADSQPLWLQTLAALALPGARNALLDFTTSPPWLYPLALIGLASALRHGPRAAALALALALVTIVAFFAPWPPSVVAWPFARYHAPLLVSATLLAALALARLAPRIPALAAPPRPAWAAFALAGLTLALYLPALRPLDYDVHQNLAWLRDLGRTRADDLAAARLVLPDNRRRFRDLSPRDAVVAATAGRQSPEAAVSVAHALTALHVPPDDTPAYFIEDLTSRLARAPGEPANPQCEAMHRTFELTAEATRDLTGPAWLVDYIALRGDAPVRVTLWRIGRRLLPPDRALALLPEPLAAGTATLDGPIRYPMGSSSPTFTDPPEPPLGQPTAPALHGRF